MPLDLRPLTLAELLDRAVSMYRRHFWLFVGIMAVPSLLALVLGVAVALFNPHPVNPESVTAGETSPAEIIGAAVWFGAAIIGMVAVYFMAYTVALGATTVAVSELYMGRTATIAHAFATLRGRIGRLATLMLLVAIRLVGVMLITVVLFAAAAMTMALGAPIVGVLLFAVAILGGIALWTFLILRYSVSIPALILEDAVASASILRSIDLTRGSLGRVFLILFFSVVITSAVQMLCQWPFIFGAVFVGPETSTGFWLNIVGTVTGAIGGAFTSPLAIVAFVVLYYDLRVRLEGLDLQMMIANLDAGTPASTAV